MEETFHRLAELLQEQNEHLSYEEARSWVEALWEDFETTRAKAGRPYKGHDMAERIVTQWIIRFGSRLHDYFSDNPKFAHLLKQEKDDSE